MGPRTSIRRKRYYRIPQVAIGATIAVAALSAGATAASASTTNAGTVRPASASAQAATANPATAYPSCHRIEYKGNRGYIAVQEKNHRLQWGIRMTPLKYSVGKWDVDTYLSGKKTTSGFHRTVKTGYVPHGSLAVPANKVFHVSAKVAGPYGTITNVPNACRT